ncbi:hypothetical protein ABK040_014261 [Willaertia magna]
MREIVSVAVGQCGNQIGTNFWENIQKEHCISSDGQFQGTNEILKENLGVYFSQTMNDRYVPRSVLVDLESGVLDNVKSSTNGKIFRPDNFISAESGAGNNWATGHYTLGAEIADSVMDIIRKEVEQTECLQGFQITHSIGGGTGSGFGTLLIAKLKEEFPDKMLTTFSVFPSPKTSDVVTEAYNAVLSINQLIENSEQVFCLDNEALIDICTKTLKLSNPSFNDMNSLVAGVMSGVTSSLRFPGQLNSDLRKLAVNLVPFPRLHFYVVGLAPLASVHNQAYHTLSISEITSQMFSKKNLMSACDPIQGKYLAASAIYRGQNISTKEVDDQIALLQRKFSNNFVEWIPNNIKSSICDVAPHGQTLSGTFIANSTSIQDVFKRIGYSFHQMYKRKAFLFGYLNEGCEEMEFTEAESNLNDLVSEYQQYQEATLEDDVDQGFGGEEEHQTEEYEQ